MTWACLECSWIVCLPAWLQGSASADDVMGAATHFLQQIPPEELSFVLKLFECTAEVAEAALQSDQGRTVAAGWIVNCKNCEPQSLLQSTRHTALRSFLFDLTGSDDVLGIWGSLNASDTF